MLGESRASTPFLEAAATVKVNPALIGKAAEFLVAAELMRRGIEVAHPASDVGVDILAYSLHGRAIASRFVPIQIKAGSTTGFAFERKWFTKAPGLVLVHVWRVTTVPEFYIFDSLETVEQALGPRFSASPSWRDRGIYTVTTPNTAACERMSFHRNRWDRIIDQLSI